MMMMMIIIICRSRRTRGDQTQPGKDNESYPTVTLLRMRVAGAQGQTPLLRILTSWKETIKPIAISYGANFIVIVGYISATPEE